MQKKMFCWVLLFSVLLVLPARGRALFLQTQGQAAAPGEAKVFAETAYSVRSFQLKYVDAASLKETLEALIAKGEKVAVNERLNAVVVRASERNLKRLTALIETLDVPPLQVQVEAKIIELKAGDGDSTNPSSLGMTWRYTSDTNTNNYAQLKTNENLLTDTASAAAASLGLYAQLISGNTRAYLEGLQKTIGYDLVASPWITALNHEEAEILIGAKYGYMTTLTTQTGTLQQVEYLEVGTKLRFTPHINEDGYIIMEIYPSVSEGQITDSLPQENTTETKNKVLVKDGQSIVIGGLTKNYNTMTEIGVPLLSSIPILGSLFRKTELQSEKREIMVIITPHIVTPGFLETMAQKAGAFEKRRDQKNKKARLIH